MKNFKTLSLCYLIISVFFILLVSPVSVFSEGKSAVIEPKADKLFREMSDYLGSLEQFSIDGDITFEIVLNSGQKIQLSSAGGISLRRPNKFRAHRKGVIADQEFYYDGKTFTLYGKKVNYYSTIAAPPAIEEALDYAIASFNLPAPGVDLLYKNTYDELLEDAISGFYVGLTLVGGVQCHHLAFRGKEVDWQIWIQNGEKPLPVKYLITSKWITGAPQYTVVLSNWNLKPDLGDDLFIFKPPKGAEKIDFIPFTFPDNL